jgi:hypothetical protein
MLFKLKKDFQHTNALGQIQLLSIGAKIDKKDGENYIIKQGNKILYIDAKIVESNPDFFEKVDFRSQLTVLLKTNNTRTAPKLAEIVETFINDTLLDNKQIVDISDISTLMFASKEMFKTTQDEKYLSIFQKLGWGIDENGIPYKL